MDWEQRLVPYVGRLMSIWIEINRVKSQTNQSHIRLVKQRNQLMKKR